MEKDRLLSTLRNNGYYLVDCVVAKEFLNSLQYHARDDLIGYGMIGLTKAIKQYDGEHDFVNFAWKKIRQSILDYIRQQCQRRLSTHDISETIRKIERFLMAKRRHQLNDQTYKNLERYHCKRIPWPCSVVATRDSFDFLTSELNKDRKWLIRQMFVKNLNWQEIKQIKGWSKSKIFEERRRALKQIRAKLSHRKDYHGTGYCRTN